MPASRWAVVTLVAVLALAGCSGFAFEGSETPTPVTPAPVPDAASDAGPPGVSDGEVTSARLLGRAHGAALNGTGYTVVSNRTVVYPNGTVRSQIRTRVALEPSGTYLTDIAVRGPHAPVLLGRPPATATFWSDGDRHLRRLERDDQTVYNEYTPPDSYAGTWRYWVRSVALDGTPARDVTETVGSFRTLTVSEQTGTEAGYLIRGRGLRADESVTGGTTDPTNASLTARVRGDGVITSYRVRYVARTPDGERVRVRRVVRFTNVGETTVGRPDWYDRATDDGTVTERS